MSSVNLGRVFDIKIKLHYSWFIILLLLAWSLATNFFPSEYQGLSATNYWILGGAAGVLLFACVLAHELSHSLVAKHHGMKVRGITLFFFGGIANTNHENLDPEKELQIALAGPILSVVLGASFFLLTFVSQQTPAYPVIDYLFKINLILAGFNMIPGYPLDGGRVFRALAWKHTDDIKKATKWASNGGKLFGGTMIIYGLLSIFTGGGGLWYVLLGGFLYILAKASYEQLLLQQDLGGVTVRRVMAEDYTEIDPEKSLESFVHEQVLGGHRFVCKDGEDVKVVDFDKLREISRTEWPVKQVKDILVDVEPLREHWDAFKALQKMHKQGANLLPVVKSGKVTGVVTMNALMRTAQLQSADTAQLMPNR